MSKKIHIHLYRIVLLCVMSCFCLQSNVQAQRVLSNPNSSPEAKALYCYIQSTFGKKTLSGQMWSGWGFDELNYIQTNTGKQPAILGVDFIAENVNNTQVQLATNYWKKGGIPTIMWHWGAPGTGEGYPASQNTIDINRCFQPGTAEYTAFWAELTKKADHLQTLRDANIPVLWRPFHELNGTWFWWSKGGPTQFKQLWTTMYNYFVNERKLNNLIWVLCYTGSPDGAWFPGNQYVDIAGGDEYATNNSPQLALFNKVKSSIGGNTMPTTLHECGIPPDPDQAFSQGATWSWWMEWHTDHLQGVDKTYLKTLYNHNLIITLDEVPNIMAVCGSTTNPPPTVSITSPANNATFTAPASVTINATAADVNGTVSNVQFFNGTTLLSTDATSPYSFTWTNVAAGTYSITAKATDNGGAVTTSSVVTVKVNGPCVPTAIVPFTQINAGTWTQTSTASLNAGGTVMFGPQPVTGGSWKWTGPSGFNATTREITFTNVQTSQAGNYVATYTNTAGCTSTNTFVISVIVPNVAPTVSISAPANNATFTSPASITITANAADADGTVSNVQFFNGTTLLGSDATNPYSFSWTGVAAGTYNITAKATDNSGAVTTSTAVTVVVKAPNVAPTVSISAPLNNATFTSPASITITANAADADGTVSNVQFFNGTTLLGTSTTLPYSFAWTGVAAGTYSLTAKATDNSGAITTSAAVTVVVSLAVSPTIQAETACAVVGILSENINAGFHGVGYVNTDNVVGSTVSWAFNSQVAQTVGITFRYANASANNRTVSVKVNGVTQLASVSFISTGAWTTWSTVTVQLALAAGNNAVQFVSLTAEGAANIDEISFNKGGITAGTCSASVSTTAKSEAAVQSVVAPNPATSTFTLTVPESVQAITVVDINGSVVYRSGALAAGESVEFGNNLISGLYTVTIQYTSGRVESKKIQKVL